MELLQHECGVALVRTSGDAVGDSVPDALHLLTLQRHRGRQGAGLATDSLKVVKFAGDDALNSLSACDFPQSYRALGHIRYATNGNNGIDAVHPFVSRNGKLALCGNFHFGRSYNCSDGQIITDILGERICESSVLQALTDVLADLPGGFVLCGITADGDSFAVRDRHGIRPAYYVRTHSKLAVASERYALQTVYPDADVHKLPPGHVIFEGKNGCCRLTRILPEAPKAYCPFERIYFSSGKDPQIAVQRRRLGRALASRVADYISPDEKPVLTYVPYSAEHAWQGLAEALGDRVLPADIIRKNVSGRTFLNCPNNRTDEVRNAYRLADNASRLTGRSIILVDDSIVRGTTFRESNLLVELATLQPPEIIIVSSAPPVLFPDYYGIDIPVADDLIARKALQDNGSLDMGTLAASLMPDGFDIPVKVIYQRLEDLREILGPEYGTWVFSGDYPC